MADVNIKVNIVSRQAERGIDNITKRARRAEKSFDQLNLSIKNSTSAFKVFAGNVAATAFTALTRGLVNFAGQALETARQTEQ